VIDKMILFMQKRLQKIMKLEADKREIALREYAQKLGCSLSSSYTSNDKHLDEITARRIQAKIRSVRDYRLWLIALISTLVFLSGLFVLWVAIWNK
jgi:hypothetical protein